MNIDSDHLHRDILAIDQHPLTVSLTALAILAALACTVMGSRRLVGYASGHSWQGEKVGTLLAAAIATGVSAQGMWVFMGDALHLTVVLRVMFFGFLETMAITSAVRARTAQRATGTAGVDGIAMWVLTSLSAVLSATEADNLATVLIRLSAPLVAAWGWERSMALEHRLRTGHRERINWRITPQRLLIRLGLADPDPHRTASDETAERSLIAVALAVDDARVLRDADNPNPRKVRKAQQRLRVAMRQATASGGLIPFAGRDRRDVLCDHIAVLRSTSALLDVDMPMVWPSVGSEPRSSLPVLRSDAQDSVPASGNRVDETAQLGRAVGRTTPTMPEHDCATAQSTIARPNGAALRTRRATGLEAIDDHQLWAAVAEQVCAEDPARRRRPRDVEAILRLHYFENRTYPQIARQVDGFSTHAVGRVIRQARKYHPNQHIHAGRGAEHE